MSNTTGSALNVVEAIRSMAPEQIEDAIVKSAREGKATLTAHEAFVKARKKFTDTCIGLGFSVAPTEPSPFFAAPKDNKDALILLSDGSTIRQDLAHGAFKKEALGVLPKATRDIAKYSTFKEYAAGIGLDLQESKGSVIDAHKVKFKQARQAINSKLRDMRNWVAAAYRELEEGDNDEGVKLTPLARKAKSLRKVADWIKDQGDNATELEQQAEQLVRQAMALLERQDDLNKADTE